MGLAETQAKLTRAVASLESRFSPGKARWKGREYPALQSTREATEEVVLGGFAGKFRMALTFRLFDLSDETLWPEGKPVAGSLIEFPSGSGDLYRVLSVSEALGGATLRVSLGDPRE